MRIGNGIIEIIEGRLYERMTEDYKTTNIRLCRRVNKIIKDIQSKSLDIQMFGAFKKMLEYDNVTWREAYPDNDTSEFNTIEDIKNMYESFEKQYENGAGEEEIKSDFALCCCSAYRKITDKDKAESKELLEMMKEAGIIELPKESSQGKEEK